MDQSEDYVRHIMTRIKGQIFVKLASWVQDLCNVTKMVKMKSMERIVWKMTNIIVTAADSISVVIFLFY